jgi:hypothetical protein
MRGSTLAMLGAYTLATALGEHAGDYAASFSEARHRRLVDPRQKSMALAASLLVPRSGAVSALRNTVLRLAPLLVATRRLRRRATEITRTRQLHPQSGR